MTYMTLAQRIELELGKREPSEIIELNLDNSKASDLEGVTDDFVKLEVLSLSNVGLKSLANLPNLPALRTLELSNNLIAGGLDALLSCPKIEQLNLSNNKIESFESLAPLVKLSCLRSLDLANCPVAAVENYRKKAFAMLKELKYLDGLDENEEEEPAGEEITNGDLPETGDDDADEVDEDEEVSDVDDDDEADDEIGIEALQRSGELEDDEEDYAPGEDEEAELDDYDDVDEDDDDVEEDTGVNLSAAGVTGPRRPAAKRRHEDEEDENDDEEEISAVKHKPVDGVDAHINNGSAVDK